MDIHLDFLDESDGPGGATVVVFQKNVARGAEPSAIAWQVAPPRRPGRAWSFSVPRAITAGATDSSGNSVHEHGMAPGEALTVLAAPSGALFGAPTPATSPVEIQVRNALPHRPIDASLYRGRRLLARRAAVQPHEFAPFRFDPTIWIGVAPVIEGQVMHAAMLAGIDAEFPLAGVDRAGIVMRGGGPRPYRFELKAVWH